MFFETEKIKTLLPYVGSTVIFCGFIKLYYFYYHFNIKISDYLEISEVLTLVLWDIVKATIIIILSIALHFFTTTKEQVQKNVVIRDSVMESEILIRRLKRYIITQPIFAFSVLLSLIMVLVFYFLNHFNFISVLNYFLFQFLLFFFLFVFLEYKRKYILGTGKSFPETYNNLIVALITFFVYNMYTTFEEINRTSKGGNSSICFYNSENVIQSTSDLFYIGQTKNYLFMYNKKSKETYVYLRSEIKNIVIR